MSSCVNTTHTKYTRIGIVLKILGLTWHQSIDICAVPSTNLHSGRDRKKGGLTTSICVWQSGNCLGSVETPQALDEDTL